MNSVTSISISRVLVATALLLSVSISHAEIAQRIVGGNVAQDGDYPWMSLVLITPSSSFCGATLVGKQWVLTAAHCANKVVGVPSLVYEPSEITVFPGLFDLTKRNAVGPVEVVEVFVHPDFRFGPGGEPINDAALLKLSTPQDLPTLAIADAPVM
ncbi:MAG: trypsin-like serine protease, partial [Gammaproteobacteria bacterium]|nr:trypsin-like serine protease [Gammaproteobacteria bacterium]